MYRCAKLRQKRNPKADWRTEDLEFLLAKAQNENWATRVMAFQKIYEVFEGRSCQEGAVPESAVGRAIAALVQHLEDAHVKVSSYVARCLPVFLRTYPHLCAKHAVGILRSCLRHSGQEAFGQLLQQCKEQLSFDVLAPLLQFLEQAKTTKERTACLDFLVQLIQSQPAVVEGRYVGLTVRLMANLISEHKDKSVALPALAVLSLVKSRNASQTLNALLSIGQGRLERILDLAREIEPELEGSILRYIESVEVGQAVVPGVLSQSSLERLLGDEARKDELVELLVGRIRECPGESQPLLELLGRPFSSPTGLSEKSFRDRKSVV